MANAVARVQCCSASAPLSTTRELMGSTTFIINGKKFAGFLGRSPDNVETGDLQCQINRTWGLIFQYTETDFLENKFGQKVTSLSPNVKRREREMNRSANLCRIIFTNF